MLTTDQALQYAIKDHEAGRLSEAERIYQQILARDPRHADALHLLGVLNGQTGRIDIAVDLISKAVKVRPDYAEAYSNLGRVLGDQGNSEKSIAAYRRVTELRPAEGSAWYALGIALRLHNQPDLALAAFEKAIRFSPALAEAHTELGNILRSKGRLDEAIDAHSRAVALQPGSANSHYNFANALLEKQRIDEAIIEYMRAVELKPDRASFHLSLGNALSRVERFREAMMAYDWAMKLSPDDYRIHSARGAALDELGFLEEALEAHRRAVALKPDDAIVRESMGHTLRSKGDLLAAEQSFRIAVDLAPDSASAHSGLGGVLRLLGRFDDAASCLRRALELDPDEPMTIQTLGSLSRAAANSEIERLTQMLSRADLPAEDRISAGFGLGKLYDDADRFDEAFPCFAEANALVKQRRMDDSVRFDADKLHEEVDELIATFTPAYFSERREWGDPTDLPVFIVGMPRSGTTLVEQIAASHSKVVGAGELNDIANYVTALGKPPEQWDRESISQMALRHKFKLMDLSLGASRVIDKMPANIMNLGLIATFFPNARVIFSLRDPRDNCLSCYFQMFVKHKLMFTYDLVHCATQYLEQERLRAHWQKALPLRMMTIQYEELVGDLEGQSRRLIDFLGLPWEPACLDFHKTERPVLTASFWQVRQPLYSSSVGRWKNYESHLGPLLKALDNGLSV